MADDRLSSLEALVAADPGDLFARFLLGNEFLGLGRDADALPHLSAYCERFEGDKGAACLSLARARHATGDRAGAMAAVTLGVENARAHRHRQLLADLEAERDRIVAS
jgi:predicted Zn-dependent protease